MSTDSPADGRKLADRLELPFDLLSDDGAKVIRALGLLHENPFGHSGDVARPAAFLIDRDGRVAWRHLPTRVQDRADPDDILAQVRMLRGR